METSEIPGKLEVRPQTAVFQLEANDVRSSQEQMVQVDKVLKSLSPLINSMRPFDRLGSSPNQ